MTIAWVSELGNSTGIVTRATQQLHQTRFLLCQTHNGTSGCWCSLSEQSKSVLLFHASNFKGNLSVRAHLNARTADLFWGLHLWPSTAKSSPELRKLFLFSVQVRGVNTYSFFFFFNRTDCLKNSFYLFLVLKDTYTSFESSEAPVLKWLGRTCESCLHLPARWPTSCWACHGEHLSSLVHEVPGQAGQAWCHNSPCRILENHRII